MLLERGIVVSMKQSADVPFSDRAMLGAFVASSHARLTFGTSTRWSSTFPARNTVPTRLMQKQGMAPKRIITDKLSSYGAARQVMPRVEHRSHKGLNNRAENSHVPLRKREQVMQGLRSPGGLQRLTSVFSAARNLFVPPRSRQSAIASHIHRLQAMAEWKFAAGVVA
jgi:DDE domain